MFFPVSPSRRRTAAAAAFVIVNAALLAGCGGGGSGSAAGPAAGRLAVFVTDGFSDDYDQVWVTIHKVELLTATGAAETVFDDSTAGRVLNLTTLRDAAGQRFALLGSDDVNGSANTPHTQVRVTLGPTFSLFPRGASAGQVTPIAASVPRDAQGRPVITFALAVPRVLGKADDDLAIDFDLPNFAVAGGTVVPVLREGDETGLDDPARHENEDYDGTVTSLSGTAPNLTFTLTRSGSHSPLAIQTSAATAFFNRDGTPGPVVANGKTVEVRGVFDASAGRLDAASVRIEDRGAENENEAEVTGAPSRVNASAGTFAVSVAQARGFVPKQTTLTIVTDTATVFRASGGLTLSRDDFFARLPAAPRVEVEGIFDPATNTLTARTAKTENPAEGQEAEARGRATDVNTPAGTFTLHALEEFEGFVPSGGAVAVVTNGATVYQDRDNNTLAVSAFFAVLEAGNATVSVNGLYANGAITTRRLRLRR